MENKKNLNLFVYGTLMSDFNLRLVTGKEFKRKDASLPDFRKVTPKDSFPFVVPNRGKITYGSVLFDIDPETMGVLDRYEAVGELYNRQTVKVKCEGETIDAEVYVGIIKNIKKMVETGLDVVDRIEDQLESKIDDFIKKSESVKQAPASETSLSVRIRKELLGSAVENMVKAHFKRANLPAYLIEKTLGQESLPTLGKVKSDKEILKYADNYINFALRHIIFNQVEEKTRQNFRGSVKVTDEFYLHSISMMIALKYLNSKREMIAGMMSERGADRFEPSMDYTDYARKGILIADALYSRDEIRELILWVKKNRSGGATPLGAELEFSNSGRNAVKAAPGEDIVYDNFYYFSDFDLMRRLWKLGGHIDDHRFITSSSERTRGFLEYAFGRYMILGDLSKPVTQDPWILANLIKEGAAFSGVSPHSLHISIQVNKPVDYKKRNNVDHLLCLLLLGGDIGFDGGGVLREKRIFFREIIDSFENMNFSDEKIHYYSVDHVQEKSQIVVEYAFPRLFADADYEPLISALKGFQIGENPRPMSAVSEKMGLIEIPREEKDFLLNWSASPRPLGPAAIEGFIKAVEKGLTTEKKGRPAHKEEYICGMLRRIKDKITEKNEFIKSNNGV